MFCLKIVLLATFASGLLPQETHRPIMLDRSGGFQIGGKIISNPQAPDQTLSCDHGYAEYFIPWSPRKTSLVMWHSSSTQVWQNRWDGGEGFKDKFLRRDYPVYLWDSPWLGRANWACKEHTYVPSYRDQGNFDAWNFGPSFGNWWPGVQFPAEDGAAWQQATSARYEEFDNDESVELQSDVAAVAADSGKLGDSIVYLTNSAAGLRAQLTATKSNSSAIKGIVAYESMGFVFPEGEGEEHIPGGFGPFVVPVEDFKKLANLTAIQFVWGDNRPESHSYVNQSRHAAEIINKYGGNAEVFMLGDETEGNTHIPFADMNNDLIADFLDDFLSRNRLDKYAPDDVNEV
ncbi:hypothetical protein FQN55_004943 [Onygenales sp. PD_40]|nr:hypothetical protein FQN55_004943 [Onygenales sp. PD_40]KAK2784251.1 hypothetical protein FQN53_008691 [Emmonsiellopsis sp. PD_33]